MRIDPRLLTVERCALIFLTIDLLLGLAYLANFTLQIPSTTLERLLDLNGERSFANWYSSIKLFLIGTAFAAIALQVPRQERRVGVLWLLCGMFVVLSADEVVQIHEWLGEKSDALLPSGSRAATPFAETGIWMFIIGLPFVALLTGLIYLARDSLRETQSAWQRLLLGLCLYFLGSLAIESLSNFTMDRSSFFYPLQIACEEIFELWGATILLWATIDISLAKLQRRASA